MSVRIAILLSRVLAATLILVGIVHLGLLFYVFPSLVFGRDVLVHLLTAFIFPGLVVAGAGIFHRRQWAYYLAYAAIAANLFAWIGFYVSYPALIADYYHHIPFLDSYNVTSIALEIPGEVVAALHVVPICLLAWTQYVFTKSKAWIKPLQIPTSTSTSQTHLDSPAIQREQPAAMPEANYANDPLIASLLAIILPSLLVFLIYLRDPPKPSPGTVSGGLFFGLAVMVATPIIAAGLLGTVICMVIRGMKPRPDPNSNSKQD